MISGVWTDLGGTHAVVVVLANEDCGQAPQLGKVVCFKHLNRKGGGMKINGTNMNSTIYRYYNYFSPSTILKT